MHFYSRAELPVVLMISIFSSVCAGLHADEASRPQYESTVVWESRYVENGCDVLEDGGIFSGELACAYDHFSLGAWLGIADSEHYEELKLFAGYDLRVARVDLEVTYTHLQFYPDSENDDELSIEAEVEIIGGFRATASGVYSFVADGGFFEISLARPFAFYEDRLWLTPILQAGFDCGYRTAAHDGLNHIQLSIEAEYTFSERHTLIGYIAHSDAQDDVQREGLGDVSWIGIGLNTRF